MTGEPTGELQSREHAAQLPGKASTIGILYWDVVLLRSTPPGTRFPLSANLMDLDSYLRKSLRRSCHMPCTIALPSELHSLCPKDMLKVCTRRDPTLRSVVPWGYRQTATWSVTIITSVILIWKITPRLQRQMISLRCCYKLPSVPSANKVNGPNGYSFATRTARCASVEMIGLLVRLLKRPVGHRFLYLTVGRDLCDSLKPLKETYDIRRAARGVPDASKRLTQKQVSREGLVRLLFTYANPQRRHLRPGNPLKRIAKLEKKARALGLLCSVTRTWK
jgi:hypothetical protein